MSTIRVMMKTDKKISPDFTSPDIVEIPACIALNCLSGDNDIYTYEVFNLIDSPANKHIEAYAHDFLEQDKKTQTFKVDREALYDLMSEINDMLTDESIFDTNFFKSYAQKLGIYVAKCSWCLEFSDLNECEFLLQIIDE